MAAAQAHRRLAGDPGDLVADPGVGGRAAVRAGRALWLLALLAFVPLTAARRGSAQPNRRDIAPQARWEAYREAVLHVPAPNGVLVPGCRLQGM